MSNSKIAVSNEGSEIIKAKIEASIRNLPNPSLLLKTKGKLYDLLDRVSKHPDVYPLAKNYKDALAGLEITFSQTNFDWFEKYFDQFNLYDFNRDVITSRDYGFTVLEITKYGDFDGKTVPIKIEVTPQKYFFFDRDRKLRMHSKTNKDGIDIMATYPNKFILVQHEPTLLNPYGTGLFDIAYWIAVGLNADFEFMLQFAEEDGRNKWLGKYPSGANDDEISALLNMLVQLRNNGTAAIPEGTNIESMSNTGRFGSTNLYKSIDEMLRRKLEKIWTGTDLTMQVEGKGGYSSSQSGLDIREDAIEAGKRLCMSAVNQLVTIVQNINGMPLERLPIRLQSPRKLSKDAADIDQIYFNAGMKPTKSLLLKRGYDEDDFTLSEAKPTEEDAGDFASPDDFDGLLSSFENYKNSLKKKN